MMELKPVEDSKQLAELYAKRPLGYELDPSRPDFIIKNGLFDDDRLVAAVLGRVTCESYLLLDPKWKSPLDRWDATKRLILLSASEAPEYGILDTYVCVSPQVKCFSRRLRSIGFVKSPWELLTARI